MGVAPPLISIPDSPSVASGTCAAEVTRPLPRSLLTMSAYTVPLPPVMRTVGLLTVRSSSWLPSDFRWPMKRTPPAKPERKAPVAGS